MTEDYPLEYVIGEVVRPNTAFVPPVWLAICGVCIDPRPEPRHWYMIRPCDERGEWRLEAEPIMVEARSFEADTVSTGLIETGGRPLAVQHEASVVTRGQRVIAVVGGEQTIDMNKEGR